MQEDKCSTQSNNHPPANWISRDSASEQKSFIWQLLTRAIDSSQPPWILKPSHTNMINCINNSINCVLYEGLFSLSWIYHQICSSERWIYTKVFLNKNLTVMILAFFYQFYSTVNYQICFLYIRKKKMPHSWEFLTSKATYNMSL